MGSFSLYGNNAATTYTLAPDLTLLWSTPVAKAVISGGSASDYISGTDASDVIYGGYGNDFIMDDYGNDKLYGGYGSDYLDGGFGSDLLDGGAGNDKLYGWEGNDKLYGGTGNDKLYGSEGTNYLTGGAGYDIFGFDSSLSGPDRIMDFSSKYDTVHLDREIFKNVARGRLNPDAFIVGTSARDAEDRIIYNKLKGVLYYDPDGVGGKSAIAFAVNVKKSYMSYVDFYGI